MDARDLRIGNIVSSKRDEEIIVEEIYSDGIWDNTSQIDFFYDNLNPIPLTEEWIVKLGFKNTGDVSYGAKWFSKDSITVRVNENGTIEVNNGWNNDQWHYHVNFVHELQNYYKANEGNELTLP